MNMQNVLLNIYLVSVLLVGCASVPDASTINNKPKQFFGLTQVRDTPNYFQVCDHCPSITPKTIFRKTAPRTTTTPVTKKAHLPNKLVVHFDHASSVLQSVDQIALNQLVKALPEVYRITITGYTDSTVTHGTTANKTLARQRAVSVMNYLIKLGIDKNKLTLNASPLCCYLIANNTESGRAKNRRTEIIISTLTNEEIQP